MMALLRRTLLGHALIGSSPRREESKTSQQPSLYESANGLREGSGTGSPLTDALPSLLSQARLLVRAASTRVALHLCQPIPQGLILVQETNEVNRVDILVLMAPMKRRAFALHPLTVEYDGIECLET